MKVVFLAVVLAAVVSGRPEGENTNPSQQWPWQVGKLYRYQVESKTLAQYQDGPSSGNAFKAQFIVRVKAQGLLQAKLETPQHAQVHQELPDHWSLPADLQYQPALNLEQPFEISLEGGRVLSLRLPSSMSLPHENLLKGLIGALQVDLSTHRAVHSHQNTFDEQTKQGQFRKMETDVTGDCETLYTVSPAASEWRRELPNLSLTEEPIEITKSKNYGHCHRRVAYNFGVPKGSEWTGTADKTDEQQFISRSTTSRILAGKQGLILKAETTSKVNVHPLMFGKQKAQVLSNVKLELLSFEEDNQAEWQKPEESRVIQSLLYSMGSKQIKDDSSSSEYKNVHVEVSENRVRRSVKLPRKLVSINKMIVEKHSDHSTSSSSSESESAYINDDIPDSNEPAYAALYMTPQSSSEHKQSAMSAQKLVQEMAQQLQNPNNMPKNDFLSKFNILVRVIATMNYEQLSQISRSIEVAKNSNDIIKSDMWMIYRDAVVQAGTPPAFKQIVSWIQSKKIQGEEAAEVVASLAKTLRYPTKEIMTQFFKLALSSEVQEQKYLNSTALIAATRFINMGQVNNETAHAFYPTHMYGRLAHKHDNFVLEEILPPLSQKLKQAIEDGDSHKAQVYIKSIGNVGHRAILKVFAPYLEGHIQTSTYLRAAMVHNLRILSNEKDHYARTVLYSILRNTAEPYEVRVAAIHNIFVSNPSGVMMQAMAQMTHDDPNVNVRATLKSGIESAAKLEGSRFWKLARAAQAVRPMLTKQEFGKQYSSIIYNDIFDDENQFGAKSALYTVGGDDSVLPKYWHLFFGTNTSPGWNSISASFSSVEHFVASFQEQWSKLWPEHQSTPQPNHKYTAEKISEMLNIKQEPRNPLEAAIQINLMNQQRFFTLTEDDLKQLPKQVSDFINDLSGGMKKHYTKVYNQAQVSVMFPVAMGMPFIYKYKEPTVIHIQVKNKGDIRLLPERHHGLTVDKVEKEIQFTYARNIDGNVGFLDTLSNQYASAGVVNKVQVNIPIKVGVLLKDGQLKIKLAPIKPEQDNTVVHYSVWPYTANQKKDSLVSSAQDPTSKVISRKNKVSNIDFKFGQFAGTTAQLQGYSYSSDYQNPGSMFRSNDLISNIILALRQRDVALTHFNLKYLGKQSQTKAVTFTVMYDTLYNQKQSSQVPIEATTMQDVTPNSEIRRQEMVKKVSSGINTAKAQVVDLSAILEGPQKLEYVLTAAMADSPIDSKVKYAFFASKNTAQSNSQVNGVGKVEKPETISMNFLEGLQKELKMKFEYDIKYGQDNSGSMKVQGSLQRSQQFTEELLSSTWGKKCAQEIAKNNYYQLACHKMIVMASTPDQLKAQVTYKDVSPAVKYMMYKAYRAVEHLGYWYSDMNPMKPTREGELEIDMQANYFQQTLNLTLNSKYGQSRFKNVPIPKAAVGAFSTYGAFKPTERVINFYTAHQYQPYCTVDGSKIRTFSNRSYDYTLSRSWHVVMHYKPNRPQDWEAQDDQLVVLARRPTEQQQDVYISYQTHDGQDLEIEIKPGQEGQNQPKVKVQTNSKKISDGALTMYWNDVAQSPLLQYHTQPDGVLMMNINEDRLRVMYDGQRLVLSASLGRNKTRGICGYMNGGQRFDYMTPNGVVDQPQHCGASWALNDENSEPKTQQLQSQAQQLAYQIQHKYTTILRSDIDWQNAMESSSSEEDFGNQNVYRSRHYSKQRKPCQVQQQVQYYENHGEICITTRPLDACQSHCKSEGYKVQPVEVVCRSKLDQQFQQYRDQIRQGESPDVSGVPQNKQYRVPTSCEA